MFKTLQKQSLNEKYKKNAIYNVDHRTKNYLANVLLFKANLQYSSKEFLQTTGVDAAMFSMSIVLCIFGVFEFPFFFPFAI